MELWYKHVTWEASVVRATLPLQTNGLAVQLCNHRSLLQPFLTLLQDCRLPAFQDMHTSSEWAAVLHVVGTAHHPGNNRYKEFRCLANANQQVPQTPLQKSIP